MRPPIILFFASLILSGCIFPRGTVTRPGKLLIEKREIAEETVQKLDISYDYPDLRATFKTGTVKTWKERYGTPIEEGELQYSLWGDCQEIVIGGPLFVSGVLTFGADLGLLRYRSQTVDNMLFLFAILPGIQHSEMAEEPDQLKETKLIDWAEWHPMKQEKYKTPEKQTINFVSPNGTVLSQMETNSGGDAFTDIRDIFGALFLGPEKAVKVIELVSGAEAALPKSLNSAEILKTAKQAGDEQKLNSGTTVISEDE